MITKEMGVLILKCLVGPFLRYIVDLSTLSANATSQLNVLRHDGDTLGVDGTQIGVFEQTDQLCH